MHNIRSIPLHFCTAFKIFLDEKNSEWLVGRGETSKSPRIKHPALFYTWNLLKSGVCAIVINDTAELQHRVEEDK